VRTKCDGHLQAANQPDEFYVWIERIDNPYHREAYAEGMWSLIDEYRTDPDNEKFHWTPTYIMEDIFAHLRSIIRLAHTDQLAEEWGKCEESTPIVASETKDIPSLYAMEEKIKYLAAEVEQLKANQMIAPSAALINALYTDKAGEQDRRDIAYFLKQVCEKRDRNITAQIKTFLRNKQSDGLLVLPLSLKKEYEIVCQFGYPYTLKTYKNH